MQRDARPPPREAGDFGIRPEDLHSPRMAPFEVTPENTIQGVVNVIEPTAAGSTVYLSTHDGEPQDFVATFKQRVPSSYLEKEIPLAIDAAKAHLFDPESERSLLKGLTRCRSSPTSKLEMNHGDQSGNRSPSSATTSSSCSSSTLAGRCSSCPASWRWLSRRFRSGSGRLGLYSATAIIPATGVLYALTLAARAASTSAWSWRSTSLREFALPSFEPSTPLYGVLWRPDLAGDPRRPGHPLMTTLATLAGLLWYLRDLLGSDAGRHSGRVGRRLWSGLAICLVWRYPAETLVTGLVAALRSSLAWSRSVDLFLIVPVVIALFHTQRYLDLVGARLRRSWGSERGVRTSRSIASARQLGGQHDRRRCQLRDRRRRSSSSCWARPAAARRRFCA